MYDPNIMKIYRFIDMPNNETLETLIGSRIAVKLGERFPVIHQHTSQGLAVTFRDRPVVALVEALE